MLSRHMPSNSINNHAKDVNSLNLRDYKTITNISSEKGGQQ